MSKGRILMLGYLVLRNDPRVLREAETLQNAGYEVEVIGLDDGQQDSWDSEVGSHKLPIKKYRGNSAVSYLFSYLKFGILAALKVFTLSLKQKYDAVHVHTMPDLLVLCGLPGKLFGSRLVLDIHDTVPELYQDKFGISAKHPLIRGLKIAESISARIADKVITVNHEHAELVNSRCSKHVESHVVFNSVDEQIFRPVPHHAPPKDRGTKLIVHGTIAHRHGVDLLIQAMPKVLARQPETTLSIYGSGDAVPELQEMVKELKLTDSVEITGKYHKLEDMADFVRQADIGIIPYRKTHSTQYMLPTKLMEYLISGLSVVTVETLPIASIFKGKLQIWEDQNPDTLADLILAQIESPVSADLPEQMLWSNHSNEFLSLYSNITEQKIPHATPCAQE